MRYPFDADAAAQAFEKISQIVGDVPLYPEISAEVGTQIEKQFALRPDTSHEIIQRVHSGFCGELTTQLKSIHDKLDLLPDLSNLDKYMAHLEMQIMDLKKSIGALVPMLHDLADKPVPEPVMRYPLDPKQMTQDVVTQVSSHTDSKFKGMKWKFFAIVFGSCLVSSGLALFFFSRITK